MSKKILLPTLFGIVSMHVIYLQCTTASLPKEIPLIHAKRVGSFPYLCPDTFRINCNHIYDETDVPFNITHIKNGDTIYVSSRCLEEFFKNIHHAIPAPYILVTGNSVISVPGKFLPFLNTSKIIHWFGQNANILHHAKFTHIPLGMANPHWLHGNTKNVELVREATANGKNKKLFLVTLHFRQKTALRYRQPVYDYLSRKDFVTLLPIKPHLEYLQDLAQAKFTVSPHGAGLDCHRTWEALLVGCIPIVKSSSLDLLYDKLPVLVVKDWTQITKSFLEKQYLLMKAKKYNYSKLYAPYWFVLIKNIQKKVLDKQ